MVKLGWRHVCYLGHPPNYRLPSAIFHTALMLNDQIRSHSSHNTECGGLIARSSGVRGHQSSGLARNAIDSFGVSNPQS
jgi:hypothetical protein